MSFARRTLRRLEDAARRSGRGERVERELIRALRDANGVRAPFADDGDARNLAELIGLAGDWLRGSPARRAELAPRLAALADCLGEALDESAPRPAYRRDLDG